MQLIPSNRKPRSDKGRVQLTERDLWALPWIAEQYAARLDQVQSLLGRKPGRGTKKEGEITENAARLVVNRWKRAGLVEYRKFTVEDPGWVWVTPQGLRTFDLPYKAYEPSLAKLDHLFAVGEVRMFVEEAHPAGTWHSERKLRSGVVYRKGEVLPHMPDGIYAMPEGDIAIEAELTPKKPETLQAIVRELASAYTWVWYFVTDAARHGVLTAQNTLEPFLAERVFVYTYLGWYDDEDEQKQT